MSVTYFQNIQRKQATCSWTSIWINCLRTQQEGLAQTVYINTNIHHHFVELCYSSLSFSTELKDQITHALKSENVDRATEHKQDPFFLWLHRNIGDKHDILKKIMRVVQKASHLKTCLLSYLSCPHTNSCYSLTYIWQNEDWKIWQQSLSFPLEADL